MKKGILAFAFMFAFAAVGVEPEEARHFGTSKSRPLPDSEGKTRVNAKIGRLEAAIQRDEADRDSLRAEVDDYIDKMARMSDDSQAWKLIAPDTLTHLISDRDSIREFDKTIALYRRMLDELRATPTPLGLAILEAKSDLADLRRTSGWPHPFVKADWAKIEVLNEKISNLEKQRDDFELVSPPAIGFLESRLRGLKEDAQEMSAAEEHFSETRSADYKADFGHFHAEQEAKNKQIFALRMRIEAMKKN